MQVSFLLFVCMSVHNLQQSAPSFAFSCKQIQILKLPAHFIILRNKKEIFIKIVQCAQNSGIDSHGYRGITFFNFPRRSAADSRTFGHQFC